LHKKNGALASTVFLKKGEKYEEKMDIDTSQPAVLTTGGMGSVLTGAAVLPLTSVS